MKYIAEGLSQQEFYIAFTHNVKEWIYTHFEEFAPLWWMHQNGARFYATGHDLFKLGMGIIEEKPNLTFVCHRPDMSTSRSNELDQFKALKKLTYGQLRFEAPHFSCLMKTLNGHFAPLRSYSGKKNFEELSMTALLNTQTAAMDLFPHSFVPFTQDDGFIGLEPKHRFIVRDDLLYAAYRAKRISIVPNQGEFTSSQVEWLSQITDHIVTELSWKPDKALIKALRVGGQPLATEAPALTSTIPLY